VGTGKKERTKRRGLGNGDRKTKEEEILDQEESLTARIWLARALEKDAHNRSAIGGEEERGAFRKPLVRGIDGRRKGGYPDLLT